MADRRRAGIAGFLLLSASLMFGRLCATAAAPSDRASGPGVSVTFEPLSVAAAPASKTADVRVSRLVALSVPRGSAPSPFTPAGRFRATFEGDLTLRLRDSLSFSAQGRGKLTLSINGKAVLDLNGDSFPQKPTESVRLNKGKNHLVAVYESPEQGDAELRLFWSSRSFHPEPLPPTILSHDPSAAPLRASQLVRDGRFMVAEFHCTRCHAPPASSQPGAMPELAQDAPSLTEVGGCLRPEWMARWINNPRGVRTDAHMPRLFHAADEKAIDPRAADAAAYLASLVVAAADGAEKIPDLQKAPAGGRLFAQLNCIACHTLQGGAGDPAAAASAGDGRESLVLAKTKFRPTALRAFLRNPQAHYAWNPMPNFRLTEDEAESIAAFLLGPDPAKESAKVEGDAVRGKEVVRTSGCLNCHIIDKETSTLKAASLVDVSRDPAPHGCLAANAGDRKNAPDFQFSPEQRVALIAFASSDPVSLTRDAPEEFATRQIRAMRCTACHARDNEESLLATTYDAEAIVLKNKFPPNDPPNEPLAADQRAPLLTWTGEKLRPHWAARFIAGELAYKARPFIRARMPAFAARAELLAAGLAAQHGYGPADADYPAADAAMATIGQKLCGATPNQSFGCVQCHSVATQPPKAPFEAPSINFMYVIERLRKPYYQRWIHDPLRLDSNTKMPRFDDADDKTGIRDVFDGDAPKQYEAIWQYFLQGRAIRPPAE